MELYDEKCYSLAEHFLLDEPDLHSNQNLDRMALCIQEAVEDELRRLKSLCDFCKEPLGKGDHSGCVYF